MSKIQRRVSGCRGASVGEFVGFCMCTYLHPVTLMVRPASVTRFLMTRGRSSRQKRGMTPLSAPGRPTRCTRHHSSSNSFMRRKVSPVRTASSSSRRGSKEVVTSMSRGSDFGANTVARQGRAGGVRALVVWVKDEERGLGTGGKSNDSRSGVEGHPLERLDMGVGGGMS